MQFVRNKTFSIQAGVGANLAAVVDPSFSHTHNSAFFLVIPKQLIKW
jgi:hypothetical protein